MLFWTSVVGRSLSYVKDKWLLLTNPAKLTQSRNLCSHWGYFVPCALFSSRTNKKHEAEPSFKQQISKQPSKQTNKNVKQQGTKTKKKVAKFYYILYNMCCIKAYLIFWNLYNFCCIKNSVLYNLGCRNSKEFVFFYFFNYF